MGSAGRRSRSFRIGLVPVPSGVAAAVALAVLLGAGCVRNPPPVEPEPTAPPPGGDVSGAARRPSPPASRPGDSRPGSPALPEEEGFSSRSLADINRDSPLRPIFFGYDSSELDAEAQAVVEANADVLRQFPTWVVTIEGHCDERGTPEYNLGLGERRALAVREYLVRLGLPASQLQIVSYGKEFPFAPGSDEASWAANRRAHFVITAQ